MIWLLAFLVLPLVALVFALIFAAWLMVVATWLAVRVVLALSRALVVVVLSPRRD